jgi:RNA polymerase sigma factor (sigma-70 family)
MSTLLELPASGTVRRSGSRQVAVDAELALALFSNQPRAAVLIRQRFASLINRILRKAMGPDVDVEDVEQEVFLGIFSGMQRLRHPEALRTFVLTITKRTLGRELRRRTARRRLLVADEAGSPDAIGDLADPAARHALSHLRCLLERLRERDRRAFVLRFVEGMDTEEVARALEVSLPTARRCFMRALHRVVSWGERHPFLSDYIGFTPVTVICKNEPSIGLSAGEMGGST